MELEDFKTRRAVPPERSRLLLDLNTGKPSKATLESDDGCLARIAAVIYKHGVADLSHWDDDHLCRNAID